MNEKINLSLNLLLFGICMGAIFSCKEETDPLDLNSLGSAYYPISIDQYWIYQVDSINYSKTIGVKIDSSSSYIMELVRDSF